MGSLYKSGRIRSYILIVLIILSAVICVPVKNWLGKTVGENIIAYNTLVNDKTGLSISYESMSPSILSNFVIRGIKVLDSEGNLVFSIDKARLNLRLLKLIKGDVQNGITNITVDGLNLDVDELIDFVNKMRKQFSQQNLKFVDIEKLIPQKIRVKNIQLSYSDKQTEVKMSVKSVSLNNDSKKELLNLQVDTNVKAKILALGKTLSGKIDFSGVVTYQLENSQANIRVTDLNDGNYHLNKLNLHVAYENNKIQVHTIQSVNPISLAADYNINTSDVNVQIMSQNLSPFTVLNVLSKKKEYKALKKVTVNTDTIIKSNLNNKNVNFITDSKLYIPDELFPGGFNLDFSFYGNEKECELTKFNIDGQNFTASAKLAYEYKTTKLSGFVEIPAFVLKNNNIISTEVYFEPLEKAGFMAFSPQLFVGGNALTALQMSLYPQTDSYDFSFEAYDYSHSMDSDPGLIQLDGSYLLKSKYIQANVGLNSLYFDSLAGFATQISEGLVTQYIEKYQNKLSPFMLSGDCYVSTDLKTVSYNVPYILIANTKKDNQVLMVSFDGSEQNISLNQLSLVMGQYALSASATLDKSPDNNDMFFSVDLTSASIPYHFSGSIMPEVVNVSGDYGTEVEVHFGKNKRIDGTFNLENFPVPAGKESLIFSTDAKFRYDQENGPEVQINRFEAELNDGDVSVNPKIVMSGNMTKYGAQINSIAYTDLYSALEGTADLMLNINDNVFDSVGLMVNLKNPLSDEGIVVDGSISNPEHLPISKETLMQNIYLNLQAQLNSFGLNRFGFQQNDNNRITATIYTSGTLERPYFSLNVEDSAVLLATDFLKVKGSIVLEDKDITVSDLFVDFNFININDINAKASLDTMTLDATGNLDCVFLDKTLFAPLNLSVSSAIIPEGKIIPDSLMISLSTPEFSGSLLKKKFPLAFSVLYSNNIFNIYSSDNCGLSGTYSTDGLLELTLDNKDFVHAKLDGLISMKQTALELYDVSADIHKIFAYLNMDEMISIERGVLSGDVIITGSMNDPDINGVAQITTPEIKLPVITNQKLLMDDILMTIVHNEIDIQKTVFTVKSGERIESEFKILLNKWSLNHIEGSLKTLGKDMFPIKMSNDMFKFSGATSFDLQLYYEEPVFDVEGKIFGENVSLTANISSISGINTINPQNEIKNKESAVSLRTDLNITLGTHASINLDPLLRCVFVPNTVMKVKLDQSEGSYIVDGILKLKSGDLAYLNRNFYIKSGIIKFNPEDISNPLITVSAETRERDDRNQNIKIILSVENQYLMDLKPRFTSVPAKSENEIQSILGQIVVADSSTAANFLFAASDYAIQSTVVRTAENKLRDLFNFDIFSLRTNVLQNTLNMGVTGSLSKEKLSIGNFLDNSTVYIGKYLGSSLYVDAMLHVSFEDSYRNDITSVGSLLFQPEIGMELESPFANIRVNMVPDITALMNNQFVPSTSVTLSWKLTF